MCVILDTNRVSLLLGSDERMIPIRTALEDGTTRIVAGGDLRREYLKMKKYLPFWTELQRKGSLHMAEDGLVDKRRDAVVASGLCKSNDAHIVALAQVSGARVLCSDDDLLQEDFANPKLLKPKGRIYKDASHKHLLRQCKPTN